ncbi:MAG: OmpA family protein [Treponema sp.]|jgi:outer membrane protein OmpA-like peptidoglycan-associated protein|nr:OmpA family protein [Treponema sp.]
MKLNIFAFFFIFSILFPLSVNAERFVYKQTPNVKYRILSIIHEDVYIDRQLSHTSEIVNRIAIETISANDKTATNKAIFQTGERALFADATRGGFQWDKDYESVFERDKFGYMTIDKRYFMPVVRDVPIFPDRNLKEGDVWSAEGHEMHDFRASFGIEEPYRIPFTANYKFLGEKEWKNKRYPAFSISYRIFTEPSAVSGDVYPVCIMGASDQIVYWDAESGKPEAYTEDFRMIFELSNGRTFEFRGTAEAEVLKSEPMDKQDVLEQINRDIENLGVKDAHAEITDEGVSISLENIQFKPDSADLVSSEKEKLDKLGMILKKFRDRDILVEGHTAYSGSEASMLQLSEERAGAVAEYLIEYDVRSPERIIIRGHGGVKPIADNSTEAGRVKNRRVEITILEN